MSAGGTMIHARGVGKRYVLGGPQRRTNSFREALVQAASAPWRALSGRGRERPPEFWALSDVDFDVRRGEVLGVLGRNGAGKSTLLKVLSRITEPTTGRIEIFGRVASLLEVGTGFHAELTGRENIYLNGTILGMRKREIDRKFDEIVDFAEVERFIDTPVKRYSSGMYVRLAFAVAAHLEPEILVVDEVLAVGDAEFQKKCIGKMSDVAHGGRTVLFVSHNMAAMRALCSRALVLSRGRVVEDGPVNSAIARYLSEAAGDGSKESWSYRNRGARVVVEAVEMLVGGVASRAVQAGDDCTFRVHYRALSPDFAGSQLELILMLFSEGQKLANLWTNARCGAGLPASQSGYVDCRVPRWPFRTRAMRLDVFTEVAFEPQDYIEEALVFDSHDGDFYGTGAVEHPYAQPGLMLLPHDWSIR